MNLQEILALVNAGYTRAEIEAMAAPGTNDPTPVTPPDTQTVVNPAPAQPAAPAQPSAQDLLAQILERMGPAAPVQQSAPAPAPVQQPAPAPAPAQPTTAEGDASRILKALGALAQGVDVPNNELSIDKKMENTIKMALGVKVE